MPYLTTALKTHLMKRLRFPASALGDMLDEMANFCLPTNIVPTDGAVVSAGTLAGKMVAHYQISPAAVSATGVLAATSLTAATQVVTAGITSPAVPMFVSITGNVSGITGSVVITGTDFAGTAMTDTIALSGASTVNGIKAFKTVTGVALPIQSHTPTQQVETATAAGTITTSGNATVIVTAAGMTGSPKTKSVAVLENDTAGDWALKVRTALAADADVTALYDVSGANTAIILTRKTFSANDGTLNVSLDNGTCAGIATAASSANTTAGVTTDTVSVGTTKTYGLPHILANAACVLVKLFNGSADSGTATANASLCKNVYALNGTPDGSAVDLYYLR